MTAIDLPDDTIDPRIKLLPTTDRYGFPVEVCGRCGGTGQHSYNRMHGTVCYGCHGKKVRHTRKARPLFQEWAYENRRTREAIGSSLKVGDELGILEATGMMSVKLLGWHTITKIEVTDKECGWSITNDPKTGAEIRTPNAWRLVIHFDDGTVSQGSTNTVYRRKGWIDPAPYVAKAQVRPRRKAVKSTAAVAQSKA